MKVSLSYYPKCAGTDTPPKGRKGMCHHYMPELEKIAGVLGDKVIVEDKPYHLRLEADTKKELSDKAFSLSEVLANSGLPYFALPFDYSCVETVD